MIVTSRAHPTCRYDIFIAESLGYAKALLAGTNATCSFSVTIGMPSSSKLPCITTMELPLNDIRTAYKGVEDRFKESRKKMEKLNTDDPREALAYGIISRDLYYLKNRILLFVCRAEAQSPRWTDEDGNELNALLQTANTSAAN